MSMNRHIIENPIVFPLIEHLNLKLKLTLSRYFKTSQ